MKRYNYLIKASNISVLVTLENEFQLGEEIEFVDGGYRYIFSRINSLSKGEKGLVTLNASEYKKIHIAKDGVFIGC